MGSRLMKISHVLFVLKDEEALQRMMRAKWKLYKHFKTSRINWEHRTLEFLDLKYTFKTLNQLDRLHGLEFHSAIYDECYPSIAQSGHVSARIKK